MLNLTEYRNRADRLADHLPWAALIAPGVVLNKDGAFQRTFYFRGPDLESATEAELVATSARANNALRRLGSGWALFFDAERIEALHYPKSDFSDAASWLVDEERRAAFEGKVAHFESRYHLTLVYLPPPDAQARTENALLERDRKGEGDPGHRDWHRELAGFGQETERVLDLLSGFLPEIRALDDAETLTFLHGTISTKRHPVAVPETPMYLDGVLVDTPLLGGLEPMLGERHLRALTILGFPGTTRPGILDALNHQDFAYRWVTRFMPLDKTAATKVLTRLRRQWFAKRKSITAILREVMYNEPVQLLDTDADNKVADADLALQALGGDHVGFGYLTVTITVSDEDARVTDIAESAIAPAIIESCPQRIFLPNDRAIEPQARAAYERFGLNERQIELIARATPKRHYYLQSRRGNRLFELGLGPVALALCGASSTADQTLIDSLLADAAMPFAAAFLHARGLDWAVALVDDFSSSFPEPSS